MSTFNISRRRFLEGSVAAGAAMTTGGLFAPAIAQGTTEIVHWSWLQASDGEVWTKAIAAFNQAHKDKGVQIRMELVPEEQYRTKILAATASGSAPDFGWGTAGKDAALAKDGVTVPLDDLAKAAGLDLADFSESSLKAAKYPKYGPELQMVPMDLMSLQPLLNVDHAVAAGLDPNAPPTDEASLIEWATKLTQRQGDQITRSGILMTGTGLQPAVTWGIVAEQMGFRRASDDLKTAAVNPEAGKAAMQWVIDLFDKHKVSDRNVTDRYKAFGAGEGSIFWTGPWTLAGYKEQGLNFKPFLFPKIGKEQVTYFEMGGLQLYRQKDESRHAATMAAVKWLSDNSFLWTTEGRGASPRKSILDKPDYKTAGLSWDLRGPFVEGMKFATVGEVPVPAGPDFTIYTNTGYLARALEGVWVGQKSIDDAMAEITQQWQQDLDDA
ncbi:substrate-binding domain-containing protein [Aureimonas psammosilenae]|uniref:substrate-binding domain-containing protein n=1 Tax=Aureimonas psammosilenae TaxID=2495496 RepID=UPI001869B45E|nr:substrate-binding domain-containing protein [Aureimonas psammosilenae]